MSVRQTGLLSSILDSVLSLTHLSHASTDSYVLFILFSKYVLILLLSLVLPASLSLISGLNNSDWLLIAMLDFSLSARYTPSTQFPLPCTLQELISKTVIPHSI